MLQVWEHRLEHMFSSAKPHGKRCHGKRHGKHAKVNRHPHASLCSAARNDICSQITIRLALPELLDTRFVYGNWKASVVG